MFIPFLPLISVLCVIKSGAAATFVESRAHDTTAYQVNIPAIPRTGGNDGRGIDSNIAYVCLKCLDITNIQMTETDR